MDGGAWWAAVHGVATSRTGLSDFTFTFHFHALEKDMATHSSVLAWRIPGTGEPGGLPSMGSNRVGHDWSDLAAAAMPSRRSIHVIENGRVSIFYDWIMFHCSCTCTRACARACVCVCVCVCKYNSFFIHSPINGHLDWFHVLAIVNKATMNMRGQITFWVSVFISFS